jgi:hypothetical protein
VKRTINDAGHDHSTKISGLGWMNCVQWSVAGQEVHESANQWAAIIAVGLLGCRMNSAKNNLPMPRARGIGSALKFIIQEPDDVSEVSQGGLTGDPVGQRVVMGQSAGLDIGTEQSVMAIGNHRKKQFLKVENIAPGAKPFLNPVGVSAHVVEVVRLTIRRIHQQIFSHQLVQEISAENHDCAIDIVNHFTPHINCHSAHVVWWNNGSERTKPHCISDTGVHVGIVIAI